MNGYLLVEKYEQNAFLINTSNGLVAVKVIENPYDELLKDENIKCKDFSIIDLKRINKGDILVTQSSALVPIDESVLNLGTNRESKENSQYYLLKVENVLHKNVDIY